MTTQPEKDAALYDKEDEPFLDIWEKCEPFTMTSFARGLDLYRAVKYVVKRNVPGSFVECGVWRGGSTMIAMLSFLSLGVNDRRFFLFDTFEGITPPSEPDVDLNGHTAQVLLERDNDARSESLIWAYAELSDVKENVASIDYSPSLVEFVCGDVRQTLSKTRTGQIAILRLDTDFYDSTLCELVNLYPRLIQHGVLIIDNYGHWEGCKKAVDEFFSNTEHRTPMFHAIDYTGRIAVKSQQNPPRPNQRYDYYPPGLKKVDLLTYFPTLVLSDPSKVNWPYLRSQSLHNWRTDLRSQTANIGVLSTEEATILYNLALLFSNKRGLEIGCHCGWSTAHIVSAGVQLDVIDPALGDPIRMRQVRENINSLPGESNPAFWGGFSPSIVPAVANSMNEKWSFVFIDGNHDGEAPRLDAEVVHDYCADTAMVVFHDLTSPAVALGLSYFKDKGWSIRIYNTMQIMGVAWRGKVAPVDHVSDERNPAITQPHLKDFFV